MGYKGSGKTLVIEELIQELKRRGYRVGTVKHTRKRGFSLDQPGKNTWRHARAGAEAVVSLAPRELAILWKRRGKLEEAIKALEGLDFVLVEGFKGASGLAKIVVARTKREAEELVDDFTLACVGSGSRRVSTLKLHESRKLADLVELRAPPPLPGLDCGACGFKSCSEFGRAVVKGRAKVEACQPLAGKVKLWVDGRQVSLNPFMQNLLKGTLRGMLSSLKGAKGKRIELRVEG